MDIYTAVTDRIIAQMEQGIIPWKKPWIANAKAISHTTGKAYSLLNQMLLGCPGEYITFKQCQEAGGHIRKDEKASMVVFWEQLSMPVRMHTYSVVLRLHVTFSLGLSQAPFSATFLTCKRNLLIMFS